MTQLKSKRSKQIKYVLDNYIPSFIRDKRWFYSPIIKLWNKNMDPDFKEKAFQMTENEFRETYEALVPMRNTDMTTSSTAYVLENIIGKSVLEIGCGNGDISIAAAQKGFEVVATDLAEGNLKQLEKKIDSQNIRIKMQTASVEKLPYRDNSFDTILCLHTLEHVRKLEDAINELKRVAKKRVIVVVPKQRYFRYTCDYHLNFFDSEKQLMQTMNIEKAICKTIDNCLCYIGKLNKN